MLNANQYVPGEAIVATPITYSESRLQSPIRPLLIFHSRPAGLNWKLDTSAPANTYRFPGDGAADAKSYCNVEGVTFLPLPIEGETAVAVVSDRVKSDQPFACEQKDQSIHIFTLPAHPTPFSLSNPLSVSDQDECAARVAAMADSGSAAPALLAAIFGAFGGMLVGVLFVWCRCVRRRRAASLPKEFVLSSSADRSSAVDIQVQRAAGRA